jgi:hypothetical protein
MVNHLEELARATIDSTSATATEISVLRERAAARRRRRTTRFSALTVLVVLVAGLVGWRVLLSNDNHPPAITSKPTRPSAATTTASPTGALSGIPAPSIPADQARVALDRLDPPMVLADGKTWVANASGVDVFDPTTLQRIATIPTAAPVVTMAANGTDVWMITGDDLSGDRGVGEPYRLSRVDTRSQHVVWTDALPFVDNGHRSTWHLRLAAGPGLAWVTFSDSVLKVDAATGDVTPISLQGKSVGNTAASRDGLWISSNGGLTQATAAFGVLYIDARTNEITPVAVPSADFMWSIAATDDAAWLLQCSGDSHDCMQLVRIDAATRALSSFAVPGMAVVTGDDQIWVQLGDFSGSGGGLVGAFDPTVGKITQTLSVFLGSPPGSSSDGYTFPPFAVADGQVWSAYSGLQRTTIPTGTATAPPKTTIDLSTPLTTVNSYYSALGAHDLAGARETIALEYRPSWLPSRSVVNPDATDLKTLTRLHIKTPNPIGPPESIATWPYSEWKGVWVTYHATYRANGVAHDGNQTKFVYLARPAGTTNWYITQIGLVP